MTTQELKQLPTQNKFQIMETLWEDMREQIDSTAISAEVREILRERRCRVERGDSKLLPWDSVKSALGRG